jgi:hypothetical protein
MRRLKPHGPLATICERFDSISAILLQLTKGLYSDLTVKMDYLLQFNPGET